MLHLKKATDIAVSRTLYESERAGRNVGAFLAGKDARKHLLPKIKHELKLFVTADSAFREFGVHVYNPKFP